MLLARAPSAYNCTNEGIGCGQTLGSQTSGAAQRSHLAAIPEFKCCSASLHFRLAVYMPPYSVNVVIL